MSQTLLAFCLQKKLKVFGECLITEKKRSGFEVVKRGEAMCITKCKKKRSGFKIVKRGEAMCITRLTGIINCVKTDYLSNTIC